MSYLFNLESKGKRTGKQNRVNSERFFQILNEGWYVFMRNEKVETHRVKSNTGIAGPFKSKLIASEHLKRTVKLFLTVKPSPPIAKSLEEENWRY